MVEVKKHVLTSGGYKNTCCLNTYVDAKDLSHFCTSSDFGYKSVQYNLTNITCPILNSYKGIAVEKFSEYKT